MTGKWIGLEDAKPHQHQDVFVCRTTEPRCVFPAHYQDGEFHVFDLFGVCVFANPTHWMPITLPKMPDDQD